MTTIHRVTSQDRRFPLKPGEGVDSIHSNPVYSYAVTLLETDKGIAGTGLAFTLGDGNDLVCQAIDHLAQSLVGREIHELMADWGTVSRSLADHPQLRWVGPHKGVVHLALASITNAVFDLWAKDRGVPLWKLLLDLSPEEVVALLDLSYLDEILDRDEAITIIRNEQQLRGEREDVLTKGYPGYDTSVGWFDYPDEEIVENAKRALDQGFAAMKLKVGSKDPKRDIHRTGLVREAVGDEVRLMVDANQAWSVPEALEICPRLAVNNLYWIEEPTHPDDVQGHKKIAEAVAPTAIAAGEHIPNRVLFKNFMRMGGMKIVQVDATRVAGVSEFITVSLLARKFGLKVIPHVGDMGLIHRHLVLFNHIALGHEKLFLEAIPHLDSYFVHPAVVREGVYETPQEPGMGTDLKSEIHSSAL
ncbi:MAG: mandelate racemase [Candidatus Omnitrophica bacterium]|nr:mandelate racemase [Candidatus Omnitrophota bacterium]